MARLEVTELTRSEDLEALRRDWADLWARSPDATPFQSPAWLIPWWRQFGRGDPIVLAVRDADAGGLVGLLPLYVFAEPGGIRKLLPLGIGISDHLDALFAEGYGEAGATALLAHLARDRGRWDVCEFAELPPRSPLLRAAAPAGWADQCWPGEPCPVLPLPPTVARLAETVPRRRLVKLDYFRRRAERLGRVRFERAADAASLETLYDGLLALHGARWAERGLPGVLADPAVRRFHREAAPGLLAAGLLRLSGLRLDDRLVAVLYGFLAKRRAYLYLGGFDPDLAGIGPGMLLVGHAIAEAVREGAEAVDFLRGREHHKYLWGATDCPNHHRTLRRAEGGSMEAKTG